MEEIYLYSGKKNIRLVGLAEEIIHEDKTLPRLIPEFGISKSGDKNGEIVFEKSEENRYNFDKNKKTGVYRTTDLENVKEDLPFLASQVFDFIYNLDNTYTIHSSAVSNGKNGLIFYGDSGSGKTLTSLNLSFNYDMDFISNDRIIFDPMKKRIKGGTKLISLYSGYLNSIDGIDDYIDLDDNYEGRVDIKPEDLNLSENVESDLNFIVSIELERNTKVRVKQMDEEKILFDLYGDSSSFISGYKTLLFDNNEPSPNLDNKDLKRRRVNDVKRLLKRTENLKIKGNLNDVCKYIEKII